VPPTISVLLHLLRLTGDGEARLIVS